MRSFISEPPSLPAHTATPHHTVRARALVGDLRVDLLARDLLVHLAHAVGLSNVSKIRMRGVIANTHNLLARRAIPRDFLALRAAEFLRAG